MVKLKTLEGDIDFALPEKNQDNWLYIKSESVVFDKKRLILDKFIKDFPHLPISGADDDTKFETLTRLCSRTKKLSEWYAYACLSFSELTQLPIHLKDQVTPTEYIAVKANITKINKVISEKALERVKLAEEYKSRLKQIEAKEDAEVNNIIGNDNVLKIISLDVTKLPASLQLSIEGYTPSDKSIDIGESRKLYARELLIQFQIKLLQLVKAKPSMSLDAFLADLDLK